MQIDLTQIILAVIALIGTVLTSVIIPWIKKKTNTEDGKISETKTTLLLLAVSTAVKAAEQLFSSEEGQKKKEYVLNILKEQGYEIDTVVVDAAIEAAVLELHKQLDK